MSFGTQITSPNGGSIMLTDEAKAALEATVRAGVSRDKDGHARFDAPLDGGADPDQPTPAQEVQIWYGEPAQYPHAYFAVTYEDNGVLLRDGMDESGTALQFSFAQWAALVGGDTALGDSEGDSKNPAEVTNPDELYKTPDRGGKNKSHS